MKTIPWPLIIQRDSDSRSFCSGLRTVALILESSRLGITLQIIEVSMQQRILRRGRPFYMCLKNRSSLWRWHSHHLSEVKCMKRDSDRDLYHPSIPSFAHLWCRSAESQNQNGKLTSISYRRIIPTSPFSSLLKKSSYSKVVPSLTKLKKRLSTSSQIMTSFAEKCQTLLNSLCKSTQRFVWWCRAESSAFK